MKKIIALALALIMALSMASVAFAAYDTTAVEAALPGIDCTYGDLEVAPGDKQVILVPGVSAEVKKEYSKFTYDFTSAKYGLKGASLIESIDWEKNDAYTAQNKVYDLVVTFKENLTSTTDKEFAGVITWTLKDTNGDSYKAYGLVAGTVGNEVRYVEGAKKAADAEPFVEGDMKENAVIFAEDSQGYMTFEEGSLIGTVKLEKNEKAQVYFANYATDVDEDTQDAIEAYLGDDFDGIVEYIVFEGTGFKNDVDFRYDAYEEDPHFFYAWDGEKFVEIEAKYDDDEDVDDYVFTADAKGIILVSDVELVAADETKNPDTGANDVVGVAAALAVVSLVAAGAVSLKK